MKVVKIIMVTKEKTTLLTLFFVGTKVPENELKPIKGLNREKSMKTRINLTYFAIYRASSDHFGNGVV